MTPINKVTSAFALTAGVLFAAYVMLWIITGDARIAATIVVSSSLTVLLLGIGWAASHLSHMSRQAEPVEAQYTVSQPAPALPEPVDNFVSVDDRMAVRRSQIENTAARIYVAMWPHTAPTREAIRRTFPQLQSDGFIASVQAYLKARGRVSGGGQGTPYSWVVSDSPTEAGDER